MADRFAAGLVAVAVALLVTAGAVLSVSTSTAVPVVVCLAVAGALVISIEVLKSFRVAWVQPPTFDENARRRVWPLAAGGALLVIAGVTLAFTTANVGWAVAPLFLLFVLLLAVRCGSRVIQSLPRSAATPPMILAQ
jgi:hypothetical protein